MLDKRERRQFSAVKASSADENDDEYDSEIPQKLTQIHTNSTSKHVLWVGLAFIVLGITAILMAYAKYTDYTTNFKDGPNAGSNIYADDLNRLRRVYSAENQSCSASLKVEGSLDINALEILQKTATPKLPGIYHMNKIYNLFLGKPVYELYGIDVITFTFNGVETMINDASYEVPLELRSIPNVDPSCDVESTVNSVYYSSSSAVLEEQSKGLSGGYEAEYDWSGGVEIDGVSAGVSTSTRNAAMFGRSSTSQDARSKASADFSWSFSLEASTKLYKAEIDWSSKDIFIWKDSFVESLKALDDTPTNKTIMRFIHKWGTHVLTKAQTGSYCRETAYVESSADASEVQEYRSQVKSQSFGYQFWSADRSKSSSTASSGTTENGDHYEFSDIYCVGETQMTSSSCAAQTAEQNNPVITSYEPFPVWTISDVEDILSDEAIENFAYFIFLLLDSLERCGKEVCNDAGSCTLDDDIWTETWIRKWDGMDFNAMWSLVDNEYCFCEDGKNSANCDACLCFGDENCCCYDGRNSTWANNTCAQDLLCTADNNCIAQNLESVQCAAHSQFLPCDTRTGSVVQICASGENPDCTKTNICPSNSWSGIKCGYQDLGIWNTGNWKCSGGGHSVSCIDDDTAGDILGGICTSGEQEDCDSHCKGYAGALCVSIDGVAIDYDNCEWLYEDSFGVFMECPDGYIATGICASGREQDCSGNSHGMQCCKLSYRE